MKFAMNLVLLGAPGAGKGTQAEKIRKALDIPVLSTGNLLRQAIAAGTELGKKVESIIDGGNLVPDELVFGLVAERLREPDCARGVIFDGFPRTIHQAEALDKALAVDVVLDLEVPDDVILHRMSGRRICPNCQASYHVVDNPPRVEGVCDKCGGRLVQRKDDAPETVKARLEVYHKETEPLKDFYESRGVLKPVENASSVEATTRAILRVLGR